MEINKELLLKLKEAKTAEELFEVAKANSMELSKEAAEKLFAKLNTDGELSDDMLDSIAGGYGAQSSYSGVYDRKYY